MDQEYQRECLRQLAGLQNGVGCVYLNGYGMANAIATPLWELQQQPVLSKLDCAKLYLKEASERHPEWTVCRHDRP